MQEATEKFAYPIDHFSYSSMMLFLRNRFMFKKQYILKLRDYKYSLAALAGRAAHKALQTYYEHGMDPDAAAKAGVEVIDRMKDKYIEWGKTGTREKLLKQYTQALNNYLAETPEYHEIIGIEKSLTSYFKSESDIKFALPLKSVTDLITKNKKGEIEIVDHKFIGKYTEGEKEKGELAFQAMFNYFNVMNEYKQIPTKMIFNECKTSKNKDGSAQLQPYVIEFKKHPEYFDLFYRIYNDCTREISRPDCLYLPNFQDRFDAEQTFSDYKAQVIDVESPIVVQHKTGDFEFKEKKFVSAPVDLADNEHLTPEEKIRMKLLEFGIPVKMLDTHSGSSIIQYSLKPSRGIKMSMIESHSKDIQFALKAKTIRIQAPIIGTDTVGIEVPNYDRKTLPLLPEHIEIDTLSIPIGVNVYGELIRKDLDEMPHLLIAGATGCHAKGEKVLMFNGDIKNVEDIKIGDKLMGDNSSPRMVLKLHRGKRTMVKIIPNRWDSMLVTTNHTLSLQNTSTKKVVNITVEKYLEQNNNFKHLYKLYRVPVEFEYSKSQTIPPYLLGLWIADGTSRLPAITTPDKKCIEEWENWGKSLGLKIRREYKNNCISSHLVKTMGKNNIVLDMLRNYNLIKNKHVPRPYLIANRKQRLELLAGLIDGDGHLEKNKNSIDYVTKYKRLANEIKYLCLSLGFGCHVRKCKKGIKSIDFEGYYYRFHIGGDISEIPNRLLRKHSKTIPKQFYGARSQFKIKMLGKQNYYGFEVNKNKLYLTDDFVVTHNSGKSVMINVIIQSLSKQLTPKQLNFVLIDPKRVELSQYKDSEHVMAKPIYEIPDAIKTLNWLVGVMDQRYHILESNKMKNIQEYNNSIKTMQYIVVVVDEFADMILTDESAEKIIVRLAQKARAVGIHLILGTQRPSVDIVSGLIKANMPTRIAFMTSSRVDSQVILDQSGAEQLLGRGDMLFLNPHQRGLIRLQGLFV